MSGPVPASLLQPGEGPSVEELCPRVVAWPVLLACDHASARIPAALGGLGVPAGDRDRHIALDIGAAALTRELAARLEIPAVLSGYSRLVVDCNRDLEDPSAFPELSDGVEIPGNRGLTGEDRSTRADTLYWPYHAAIDSRLRALGTMPALVAIHSFTPLFAGVARPWHIGVLWDRDDRLSAPLLDALRSDGRICVGDNEPYSGRHPAGYTMDAHAEDRGLPHVSLEVRQDLLLTADDIRRWAALLESALRPILEALYSSGSRQDRSAADGNP